MVFAQLTWRESLRDIEACLNSRSNQLYHLGLRGPVHRATLADANEQRDWAHLCRPCSSSPSPSSRLYVHDPLRLTLEETIYALDASIINLG